MAVSEMQTVSVWLKVKQLVAEAQIEVVGEDDIGNEPHAEVAAALLEAYGSSPAGFLYFEALPPRATAGPSDALLCHPDVGVLVIEVKGDEISKVGRSVAGSIRLRRNGRERNVNIFSKTSGKMFDIKNPVERDIGDTINSPLFNFMIAFPGITFSEWQSEGLDKCLKTDQLLFKEDLDPKVLRSRIRALTQHTLPLSGKVTPLSSEHIRNVRRALGDSAVINTAPDTRKHEDENSLAYIIAEHMADDKRLSKEQDELSGLKLGRFPRVIRGVAGSGKTVVLANQVARYAIRNGDLFQEDKTQVAVLCFNRALVPFLREKIRTSYIARTAERDIPSHIRVNHLNGLMYRLTREEGIPVEYIRTKDVKDPIERARMYRKEIKAFAEAYPDWYSKVLFDAIFVDEGQDFEHEEFKLLLDLIRPDPDTGERAIVIFYDDAQNLYAKPRPNWREDIGIDVGKGDRSRVMKECFRNTREIVDMAFNVLVGSKAPDDEIIKTRTFAQINELSKQGLIEEGPDLVRVKFTERTFECPVVKGFQDRKSEKEWIATEVIRLIEIEKVKPEHILVLFHEKEEFRDLEACIRAKDRSGLLQGFMKPHTEENKDDYIFRDGWLTLSTTFSAKGYDAYVVFVVGSDLFETDSAGRASFYVGATRAKLVLYVTGLDRTRTLLHEAMKIVEHLKDGRSDLPAL